MTVHPPDRAKKTKRGRVFWSTRISRSQWSYWIKYGEENDELFHIDAKAEFKDSEIDDLTDLMLWFQDKGKK